MADKCKWADLNLMHRTETKTTALVKRAVRLGYDTVALNVDIGPLYASVQRDGGSSGEPTAKKRKKGSNKVKPIPEPFKVDTNKLDLSELDAVGKQFRQYSRLTVELNETESVHELLHNATAKQYDIVAVRVANEQLLSSVVNKADLVDLITFDATDKVPWLHKTKMLQKAVDKGLSLELSYAPALCDSSARRQVLSNGRQLIWATGGGSGVVVSSGAETVLDLRAPFDVANLLSLCAVKPPLARTLVGGNGLRLLLRAEAKKTVRGAILVEPLSGQSVDCHRRLQNLISVPEFRTQIEALPNDSTQ